MIDNKDNPPLEITGVTARGNVYQAIYLAADNESYRWLRLGGGREPEYDAAVVLAAVRRARQQSKASLARKWRIRPSRNVVFVHCAA